MTIGESLKLKVENVHGRKLILSDQKSKNHTEIVFIPKKVADRLREYIASIKIGDDLPGSAGRVLQSLGVGPFACLQC